MLSPRLETNVFQLRHAILYVLTFCVVSVQVVCLIQSTSFCDYHSIVPWTCCIFIGPIM